MVVAGQLQLFVFYGERMVGVDVVDARLCETVSWYVGEPGTKRE